MLGFMDERLREGIQELSSFDKYKKEVLSGCLDWTPMHTSELFWRQNVSSFEDKDFQILRVLLKLIESSREVGGGGAAGRGRAGLQRPWAAPERPARAPWQWAGLAAAAPPWARRRGLAVPALQGARRRRAAPSG
jgi:hypothetical protein